MSTWIRNISLADLRRLFLAYFEGHGHVILPSASLVPDEEDGVLFTTAGMHPLRANLLGRPHPAGTKLASCQKCVRLGALDLVGKGSILTFFEMLGNWSFGDYYRQTAIQLSYTFLTGENCLNLDPSRLCVTVFAGSESVPPDQETVYLWRSLGISEDRINHLPASQNWRSGGEGGPCGPDTRMFIDMSFTSCIRGQDCRVGECRCGRFVEIWDIVFLEYRNFSGVLSKLDVPSIDTGMGLESLHCVLNGLKSVYDVPEIGGTLAALVEQSTLLERTTVVDEELMFTVKILTDHLRTLVFILGDDRLVTPANSGRGYVVRKLVRRAVRLCSKVGLAFDTWVSASETVIRAYQATYPELRAHADRILEILHDERERFEIALKRGNQLVDKELNRIDVSGSVGVLSGALAFRLADTFGIPIELTQEIAAERGISVDVDHYWAITSERKRSNRDLHPNSKIR